MKEFTEKKDLKPEWKTGLILVQDQDGKVLVDNSVSHFIGLDREATIDDAIYMLTTALEEFRNDRQRLVILQEFKRMFGERE